MLPVLFLVLTCSDDDDPERFILSITISPEDGGSVSPEGGTFEDGTTVTLTGTPSEGYIFKEWTGDLASTENPVSVSMDSDMNVTLVFVKPDVDGDGVSDDVDDCLNTPEGEEVDNAGCSDSQKDSDGDGITDDNDVCPDTPGGEEVDEQGCSSSQIDTDGDGVFDSLDVCPDTPNGEEADEQGCSDSQKDTDGDGITDDLDLCSNTPGGVMVDINGCPTESSIYLDENGVTIKSYEWGQVGETALINGVVYIIVDEPMLREMVGNGEDVSTVCTTKVTDMSSLFFGSPSFNQDISSWDVSNVTDMSGMFGGDWWMVIPNTFNQDISSWDVGNVTNMSGMFWLSEFNQSIGDWDVSNVTDMSLMFLNSSFNQPLGSWNVSSVQDMNNMFNGSSINQDLSDWNVVNVTDCRDFSHDTPQWTLPKPNFTNCDPD